MILSVGLYYSGLMRLYNNLNQRSETNRTINILAYHNIGNNRCLSLDMPVDVLERHIVYLVNHNYRIVSYEEAVLLLQSNEPIPKDTVVISFDDGFKSLYTYLLPLVKKYKIPVTMFLTVGPIEKKMPLFIDALIYAISNTKIKNIDVSSYGLRNYDLRHYALREKAVYEINEYSKTLDHSSKEAFRDSIFESLGVSLNDEELKSNILTWEEVIEMKENGISFGAHSITHPSLSQLTLDDVREEVSQSKRIIEGKLCTKIDIFAYPFGSKRDINDDVVNVVKEEGFLSACTLQDGTNNDDKNLFQLKRICISNHIWFKPFRFFSTAMFAEDLSGVLVPLTLKNIKKRIDRHRNEKINLLFLIDQMKNMAGTERHLTYLVSNLNKNKFNCLVCYFDGFKDGIIQKTLRNNSIPYKNLKLQRIYSVKAIIIIFELIMLLRKKKIDVALTYHFKSDTLGVLAAKIACIPNVISNRRDTGELKKRRQVMLNKIMNHFINHHIMVCDTAGTSFRKSEGILPYHMTTIYNGVDLKRF